MTRIFICDRDGKNHPVGLSMAKPPHEDSDNNKTNIISVQGVFLSRKQHPSPG